MGLLFFTSQTMVGLVQMIWPNAVETAGSLVGESAGFRVGYSAGLRVWEFVGFRAGNSAGFQAGEWVGRLSGANWGETSEHWQATTCNWDWTVTGTKWVNLLVSEKVSDLECLCRTSLACATPHLLLGHCPMSFARWSLLCVDFGNLVNHPLVVPSWRISGVPSRLKAWNLKLFWHQKAFATVNLLQCDQTSDWCPWLVHCLCVTPPADERCQWPLNQWLLLFHLRVCKWTELVWHHSSWQPSNVRLLGDVTTTIRWSKCAVVVNGQFRKEWTVISSVDFVASGITIPRTIPPVPHVIAMMTCSPWKLCQWGVTQSLQCIVTLHRVGSASRTCPHCISMACSHQYIVIIMWQTKLKDTANRKTRWKLRQQIERQHKNCAKKANLILHTKTQLSAQQRLTSCSQTWSHSHAVGRDRDCEDDATNNLCAECSLADRGTNGWVGGLDCRVICELVLERHVNMSGTDNYFELCQVPIATREGITQSDKRPSTHVFHKVAHTRRDKMVHGGPDGDVKHALSESSSDPWQAKISRKIEVCPLEKKLQNGLLCEKMSFCTSNIIEKNQELSDVALSLSPQDCYWKSDEESFAFSRVWTHNLAHAIYWLWHLAFWSVKDVFFALCKLRRAACKLDFVARAFLELLKEEAPIGLSHQANTH